jgi:hypothetical protein
MATLAVIPVSNELLEADQRLHEAWSGMRKNSMIIGWEGFFIKSRNGFAELGYANEAQYYRSVGMGRSTWFKMIGLAEAFAHLSREEFLSMKIENAAYLSTLSEPMRRSRKLISMATDLTAFDFQNALAQINKEKTMAPKISTHDRLKLPAGIRTAVDGWQQEHGLESPRQALALMVSECTERATLVGFMLEWQKRLTVAIETASSPADLRDLKAMFAAYLKDAQEMLLLYAGGGEND